MQSILICGLTNISDIPELVKAELISAFNSGKAILAPEASTLAGLIRKFLPKYAVTKYESVQDAMKVCNSAIVLWDVRVSATGRAIDSLHEMSKPVRIFDMIRKQWC